MHLRRTVMATGALPAEPAGAWPQLGCWGARSLYIRRFSSAIPPYALNFRLKAASVTAVGRLLSLSRKAARHLP